jgi:CO/xanthine dehydrogenase Mo-binding subunit
MERSDMKKTGEFKEEEFFDNLASDKSPLKAYKNIGKRGIRRLDGFEKATGRAVYTMDIQLPGMLYGRFLTSPYPHAVIKRMDTSKAEALAGVRAVLRYDDPELPSAIDLGGHPPSAIPAIPWIAHFEGEEVGAFVVADTESIAEQALRLIEVEWEVRPFLLDVEEAIKPGAVLANPESYPGSNHFNEGFLDVTSRGDVAKGFAEADVIVEFRSERTLNTWVGPERPCGVFRWNGEYPEAWVKQQRPHISRRVFSSWFGGIPMNRVQVHCPYQGASFGGWSQMPWNHGGHYCAAVVAKRTGRPVKWNFSRREDFYGGEMDEGVYYAKVGAKKDGSITAVEARVLQANVLFPLFGVVQHLMENTSIPNIYGKLIAVAVNKGPNVPTRCEQNPNCHTLSLVFDHVAGALGLDPVEVALKNDGAEGHGMAWLDKQKAKMGFAVRDSLKECVEKGMAAMNWKEKWHLPGTKRLPNGRMHGLGFTWTHEWEDSSGTSEIAIRIERNDGTASILAQRADVGVNAETAYCQIAADELGFRVEDVFYRPMENPGFIAMTPDSSTNLAINGFAVRHAARHLKEKILQVATTPTGRTQRGTFPARFPGFKAEDLDVEESVVYVKADPSVRLSLRDLVGADGVEGPLTASPEMGHGAHRSDFVEPMFAYGYHVQQGTYADVRLRLCRQAHFMEVEVDTETGEVIVTKVANANDVGKVISWEGAEGQQYGGSYMGVGRGRSEEVIHDPVTGVMLNGNLLDYKVPTILDVGKIEPILVETGMGYGPYGTIGIGEDVATVVPALIGPAVFNAIGVRINDFPITPQRVLKALGKG